MRGVICNYSSPLYLCFVDEETQSQLKSILQITSESGFKPQSSCSEPQLSLVLGKKAAPASATRKFGDG